MSEMLLGPGIGVAAEIQVGTEHGVVSVALHTFKNHELYTKIKK